MDRCAIKVSISQNLLHLVVSNLPSRTLSFHYPKNQTTSSSPEDTIRSRDSSTESNVQSDASATVEARAQKNRNMASLPLYLTVMGDVALKSSQQ